MRIFTIANKHYHYLDCIWFYMGFTIFLQIIFEALGMSFLLTEINIKAKLYEGVKGLMMRTQKTQHQNTFRVSRKNYLYIYIYI